MCFERRWWTSFVAMAIALRLSLNSVALVVWSDAGTDGAPFDGPFGWYASVGGPNPISPSMLRAHMIACVASVTAMYSASHDESATVVCFFVAQSMIDEPNLSSHPVVERRVSEHPPPPPNPRRRTR